MVSQRLLRIVAKVQFGSPAPDPVDIVTVDANLIPGDAAWRPRSAGALACHIIANEITVADMLIFASALAAPLALLAVLA
jgi:hypothetical protein